MKRLVSVVIPAYNESDNIDELVHRLTSVFDAEDGYEWEVVIVENGSTDGTFAKVKAVHDQDPRFKILQLARNFRMDGGLTAGLNHARGDAAVLMAADLQDPPELIHSFLRKWEEGWDIVYQIVAARRGTGPIRRMNSRLFYWLTDHLTDGRIPRNVSDFRLVDRRVYEVVNQMDERNRFVRGLFAWVGFRHTGITADRLPRKEGTSGAHTLKVLDLALKGIFAHSYAPLRMISFIGVSLSVLSFIALVVLAVRFIVYGVPFAGFGTIVSTTILLFGILFIMLGVIAEYVGLIYEEVKQRPNFIVAQRVGISSPSISNGRHVDEDA